MKTLFYWLLEIKTKSGTPIYISYFKDGFAITTSPYKACCFSRPKDARAYLEGIKEKYPHFLAYDKIEILEHGFDHNPEMGA